MGNESPANSPPPTINNNTAYSLQQDLALNQVTAEKLKDTSTTNAEQNRTNTKSKVDNVAININVYDEDRNQICTFILNACYSDEETIGDIVDTIRKHLHKILSTILNLSEQMV